MFREHNTILGQSDPILPSKSRLCCNANLSRINERSSLHTTKIFIHFFKISADEVEELVHQFGFLHLRNVNHDPLSGPFHPSGFGVGTSSAGENQKAGIGPMKSIQIGLELTLG